MIWEGGGGGGGGCYCNSRLMQSLDTLLASRENIDNNGANKPLNPDRPIYYVNKVMAFIMLML